MSASPRPRHATSRPNGARQPNGRRSTVGSIAIIVFLFLAGLGVLAAAASVMAYNALAGGLKPASSLTDYTLPEETVIYDRTGETELARFGDYKRDIVQYEDIPPIILDATTAIEDKTFWANAGFDPVGILAAGLDSIRGDSRGALDDHPAARPGAAARRRARRRRGSGHRAQAARDHPVDPGDPAFRR